MNFIDIAKKMDPIILELALRDAIYDMCLYEGDEILQGVKGYISLRDSNKNTSEHDQIFFEVAGSYFEHSIMAYSEMIVEVPYKNPTVPAEASYLRQNLKIGSVGADKTRINPKFLTEGEQKTALEFAPNDSKEGSYETPDQDVMIKGLGSLIYPEPLKLGVAKAETALSQEAPNLADPVIAGTAAVVNKNKLTKDSIFVAQKEANPTSVIKS